VTWLGAREPARGGDLIRKQSAKEYSSRVQQPWCMQGDAGGRIGTGDLLKQLVTLRLPVTTDQKVGGSSPSERARSEASTRLGEAFLLTDLLTAVIDQPRLHKRR
jgi:hypothetical protein